MFNIYEWLNNKLIGFVYWLVWFLMPQDTKKLKNNLDEVSSEMERLREKYPHLRV